MWIILQRGRCRFVQGRDSRPFQSALKRRINTWTEQAFESLRRSQDTLDESERRSSLQDALRSGEVVRKLSIATVTDHSEHDRLFLQAARQLSPEKVKTICEEFMTMHFAIGEARFCDPLHTSTNESSD
jgi:hypothetical protein